MGKVVSLFGKSSEPEPSAEVSEDKIKEEAQNLVEDYRYVEANPERIKQTNMVGDEMTNYLFDVVGLVKSDNSLELRRAALKSHSIQQLTDYIVDSARMQWRAQPHMYGAAYVEWFDRLRAVAALKEALGDKLK